jgi:hypothetical protein
MKKTFIFDLPEDVEEFFNSLSDEEFEEFVKLILTMREIPSEQTNCFEYWPAESLIFDHQIVGMN